MEKIIAVEAATQDELRQDRELASHPHPWKHEVHRTLTVSRTTRCLGNAVTGLRPERSGAPNATKSREPPSTEPR